MEGSVGDIEELKNFNILQFIKTQDAAFEVVKKLKACRLNDTQYPAPSKYF